MSVVNLCASFCTDVEKTFCSAHSAVSLFLYVSHHVVTSWLVFPINTQCVSCAVRPKSLHVIPMRFNFQTVKLKLFSLEKFQTLKV